jgi:hypothetical protein
LGAFIWTHCCLSDVRGGPGLSSRNDFFLVKGEPLRPKSQQFSTSPSIFFFTNRDLVQKLKVCLPVKKVAEHERAEHQLKESRAPCSRLPVCNSHRIRVRFRNPPGAVLVRRAGGTRRRGIFLRICGEH